ncbi:MAG: hypothetical protein KKD01_02550 [Proteobacteria bacterium]|nr:hypothetical protein [Pseudomonadota bacterium]MBU1233782.1 hypothetical protein [Pseudomonadota bacterium]MBU1418955.1 hypothetical protein [Pseudomonadota bacterium]MBU1453582.1 hypothetical protein [Pseudomonadota bacterium]
MNVFFYADTESAAADQFRRQLFARNSLSSIAVIPEGSQLNSHHSLKLRSGDVMILFAATDKEFKNLLAIHDKFDQFRVILVLPNLDTEVVAVSHMLKPRFITFIDHDIADLEKVITRIRSRSLVQP